MVVTESSQINGPARVARKRAEIVRHASAPPGSAIPTGRGGRVVSARNVGASAAVATAADLPGAPTDRADQTDRAAGLPGISTDQTDWADRADWADWADWAGVAS